MGSVCPPELRGRALGHALDGVELWIFLDRRGHEAVGRNAHIVARGVDDGQVEIVGDAHVPAVRERGLPGALQNAGLLGVHMPGIPLASKALHILHDAHTVYHVHVRDGVDLVGERPARRRAVSQEHFAGGRNLRRAPDDRDFVRKVRRVFLVLDMLNGAVDALAHAEARAARRRVEADQVIAGLRADHAALIDAPDDVPCVGDERDRLAEKLIAEDQIGADIARDD